MPTEVETADIDFSSHMDGFRFIAFHPKEIHSCKDFFFLKSSPVVLVLFSLYFDILKFQYNFNIFFLHTCHVLFYFISFYIAIKA